MRVQLERPDADPRDAFAEPRPLQSFDIHFKHPPPSHRSPERVFAQALRHVALLSAREQAKFMKLDFGRAWGQNKLPCLGFFLVTKVFKPKALFALCPRRPRLAQKTPKRSSTLERLPLSPKRSYPFSNFNFESHIAYSLWWSRWWGHKAKHTGVAL